jgi:hypothetical protein
MRPTGRRNLLSAVPVEPVPRSPQGIHSPVT